MKFPFLHLLLAMIGALAMSGCGTMVPAMQKNGMIKGMSNIRHDWSRI